MSPVAFESAAGVGAGWVAFGDGSFGCWVRFVPFSAGRFWGVAPGVGRRFVGLVGRVLGRGVALFVFEFAPGAGVVSSSWLGGGEVVFDMRVRADDGAVVVSTGRMRRSRCWLRVAFGGAAGVEGGGGGVFGRRGLFGVWVRFLTSRRGGFGGLRYDPLAPLLFSSPYRGGYGAPGSDSRGPPFFAKRGVASSAATPNTDCRRLGRRGWPGPAAKGGNDERRKRRRRVADSLFPVGVRGGGMTDYQAAFRRVGRGSFPGGWRGRADS